VPSRVATLNAKGRPETGTASNDCLPKNYFLVVVSFLVLSIAILEESALILEESAAILEESVFVAVESFAASEPALLQAAKAPIANTIKNFFISDCFLN
jgi:hypothetical protein